VLPSDLSWLVSSFFPILLSILLPRYFSRNVLESLPLNANGKVDRRLLPAPEGLRPEMETNYLAPQTPMERTIAAAWQEMLHMERIGIHDNFFDLGGHSLLMVQVQDKLREVLNRDLTIVDMFKYPTISSLAKYLSQKQGDLSLSRQSDERIEKLRDGKNRLKRVRERTPRGIRNGKEC
jgi:acyl carrier protein